MALTAFVVGGAASPAPAQAQSCDDIPSIPGVPNPVQSGCEAITSVPDIVTDPGGAAADVLTAPLNAAGDQVMQGVTKWVANGASWLVGEVGKLIDEATTPRLDSPWFERQYTAMATLAAVLALPLLLLSIVQGVLKRDGQIVVRAAFVQLPAAFLLTAGAVEGPAPSTSRAGRTLHMVYTGVLSVRVRSFGLLDQTEQERRLAGWGSVLAGLARENSPVRRLQWIERTVPSDGDQVARYLLEERDPAVPLATSSVASYIELVESAGAVTQDHELFVAVQIDAKRAWRQVKRLGKGDQGAVTLLLRELETLAERLVAADIQVVGALRPRTLARVIRDAYDPYGRAYRNRLGAVSPEQAGTSPAQAWPLAADATWGEHRTDSALHATYWVAQWPRIDVGATFIAPLLMQTSVLRSVCTVMEPVAPSVAIRKVEAAQTTDIADEQTRARGGFVTTARKRQQQDATMRREDELADGHAEFRFAGYVTVSAPDEEALERSCAEVEHAAQQARLELVRLYGQQAEGFTFTLPLGRGLR